jgi:hypothetical protein
LSFICANAGEVKIINPITDRHKHKDNHFQRLIFLTSFWN